MQAVQHGWRMWVQITSINLLFKKRIVLVNITQLYHNTRHKNIIYNHSVAVVSTSVVLFTATVPVVDSLTATSLTHYDTLNIAPFEALVRLGYDIISMGNRSPAFWDNVVILSSKFERRRPIPQKKNTSASPPRKHQNTHTHLFWHVYMS
jgi:hypothetical protein